MDDLVLAARNGWVYSLDNLSGVKGDTADTLCRLATGTAFRTRKLYTNGEECILKVCRPVMLNGISDVSGRADLVQRCILVNLPTITETARRVEHEIDAAFDALWARLLGAVLSAVSCALRNRDGVTLAKLPRMADFTRWVVAAEPSLPWTAGTFLATYRGNQDHGVQAVLESNPVGAAVMRLGNFSGRPSDLLERLSELREGRADESWPRTARGLTDVLRRLAPALRVEKFRVDFDGCSRTKSGSCVKITDERAEDDADTPWVR